MKKYVIMYNSERQTVEIIPKNMIRCVKWKQQPSVFFILIMQNEANWLRRAENVQINHLVNTNFVSPEAWSVMISLTGFVGKQPLGQIKHSYVCK